MTNTPTPRQLPGVKGQWILCSDCPPTHEDADDDGDVHVFDKRFCGSSYAEYGNVSHGQYWRPGDRKDPRPFTLPAETTPQQTVAVARKFAQVMGTREVVFAVADDGTAWFLNDPDGGWEQLSSLPDREVG